MIIEEENESRNLKKSKIESNVSLMFHSESMSKNAKISRSESMPRIFRDSHFDVQKCRNL